VCHQNEVGGMAATPRSWLIQKWVFGIAQLTMELEQESQTSPKNHEMRELKGKFQGHRKKKKIT
jgi:hypothetical protein